jgi:hypothetical protein
MTDPAGGGQFPPLDVGNPFLDLSAPARLEWWRSPQWPDRAGLTVRTGGGTLTIGLTVDELNGFIAADAGIRDQLAATSPGLFVPNGNLNALRAVIPPPPSRPGGGGGA